MSQSKKIAFLFPGQGAQYPGMGRDFIEQYAIARHVFEEADDILERKLSKIILEGPEASLMETKNSQTGLFVVCHAMLAVLSALFPSLKPSVCAGLSLGEYTALTAAKMIAFQACLPLVQYRGQFMNEACEKTKGTMVVVVGLEGGQVEEIVKKIDLPQDLWVANLNCPGQVVLSGTLKGIEKGTEAVKVAGAKRVLPLQVHGAFHSGLMREAEERLAEPISQAHLVKGDSALVMNVPGDFVQDISTIRQNLIKQVTHPVRWEQGIRAMQSQGVDLFIEIGPGKTLAGMNKRIGTSAPTVSIEKIEDLELLTSYI